MNRFQNTLKLLAIGIFGVSSIHIFLGVSSEVLLGSGISELSLRDPNLDSQNRFYGAAFALYGAVLWLCSMDIRRYRPVLHLALLCFFIAGLTRLLSGLLVGTPTPPLVFLAAIEILGPPAMYAWLKRSPE